MHAWLDKDYRSHDELQEKHIIKTNHVIITLQIHSSIPNNWTKTLKEVHL